MKVIAFLTAVTFAVAASAQDPKADGERALREIEAFTTMQARTDPHFRSVEDEVLKRIDEMFASQTVSEWAATVKRWYFAASERAHRLEREAIAALERQAFEHPPVDTLTWEYFERRLKAIGAMLEAGRIGPRGQALHANEAAKLYFPNDAAFLAYRQARVPIATAFEMGRITRDEFDARWARAGEEFSAVRRSQDQGRAELELRIATEELHMQQRQLERLAPRPTLRCRTTTTFGVTETRCR